MAGCGLRERIRLLTVIPSLGGGGAERALVNLVRHLDRGRFQVQLAAFEAAGPFRQDVPAGVALHDMQGRRQYDLRMVVRLARLLRLEQPDVVLSVMRYANLVTFLAARLARFPGPIIVNEQNNPGAEFGQFGGRWLKGPALQFVYPRVQKVTSISRGIATELAAQWGVPAEKIEVIPNPVDITRLRRLAQCEPPHPWLTDGAVPVVMGVGRLHPQKDFGLLLRALRLVRDTQPARLIILGEGPQRALLERSAVQLGVAADVLLPGFQENPFAWMTRADVFVLSSRYEGFGNVIVEAMALGRPVVATNCPFGPGEIIVDGGSGLLVPVGDESALAQAICRVLNDSGLRKRLAEAGRERSEDFASERIAARYEQLLVEVCDRRAHSHHNGRIPT
ncbi:MAG: glycosyltransferase [Anaerolineae bacterium]